MLKDYFILRSRNHYFNTRSSFRLHRFPKFIDEHVNQITVARASKDRARLCIREVSTNIEFRLLFLEIAREVFLRIGAQHDSINAPES